MPDVRVQDEQGNVHVFPDGSTPEMIAQAMNVKPPDAASAVSDHIISSQPKPWTLPWIKSQFYRGVDATANALPAAGATIGGVVGAPESPVAAVGGAGIGGMAGNAAKHLLRRAAGFEESNDPNAVAKDITKEGAIQGTIQGVTEGLPVVAPALKNAAVGQYERALSPTTKVNKAIAEKIAPEMVNRGLHGNLDELATQAGDQAATIRPQLDAAYNAIPANATQGSGQKIVDSLEQLKNKYVVNGQAAQPAAVKAISDVQDIVRQQGNDISPESLRQLKQVFDEPVAAKGGYAGADLSTQYNVKAQKAAANSIRGILSEASPDVASLNKEISFWLEVQRVTSQSALRKTGQEGGLLRTFEPYMLTAGGALGLTHGPEGGLIGATGTFLATHAALAMRTPAWRTASAVVKSRFADALARGDVGQVLALSSRFAGAASATVQDNAQSGH